MMKRVGLVGLGAMGRPIAEQIASKGFPVVAFDLDPAIQPAGVRRVPTLAKVAESDVVIVIVPTDDDVREVVAGPGGLIEQGHKGMTIIVSASVHPATCHELHAKAAGAGIGLLDAALTGGVRRAQQGQINLLVGGDRATADNVRDVLESFTAGIHVLGPPGAGQVGKAANNLIHWAEIVTINEAFRLAKTFGVDVPVLRSALEGGVTDSATMREIDKMRFTWYRKDLELAQELADEIGIDLPVASLALGLMDGITPASIAELLEHSPAGGPALLAPDRPRESSIGEPRRNREEGSVG
jgi:3-hydroxyisobutyrate dehydrogenase-like beta-hydroxyacid dehydrogenase